MSSATQKKSSGSSPLSPGSPRDVAWPVRFALVGTASDEVPDRPNGKREEVDWFRGYFCPISLVIWTLMMAQVVPIAVTHFNGSLLRVWTDVPTWAGYIPLLPLPSLRGLGYLFGWSFFQAILMHFLPGKDYVGPVTPAGHRPVYRNNGILAWIVTHGLWLVLGPLTHTVNFGRVYDDFAEIIATNNVFGVPFTIFLIWKGMNFPSSRDCYVSTSIFFDFFQGVELHPRLFGLSLKQLLNCRISMMGWSIVFLCFAEAQYDRFGYVSNGMAMTAFLLVTYLLKFFWWETGYFTSIDVAHDRCGYYIVWGLLTWVPTAYCTFGYFSVEHPANWNLALTLVVTVVGLVALWVNWDADHQRQYVRENKGKVNVWGQPAKCIEARYTASDGSEHKSLLLYSGYWGLSRHFHYVPELTMAVIWTLPAGTQCILAWLYFAFLFCLLVDRSNRDEGKCNAKYGKYWVEYRKLVPYKILPYVY